MWLEDKEKCSIRDTLPQTEYTGNYELRTND